MLKFARIGSTGLFCAAYLAFVGCNKPDTATPVDQDAAHDHDHEHGHGGGDHPETLAEAVEQVAALNVQIKSGLAADEKDKVHDALHEVGHVLEDAEGLLKNAGLSEADEKEAAAAIEELFKGFGQVDEKLYHGGEGKTYVEASENIDAAISVLESLVKPKGN